RPTERLGHLGKPCGEVVAVPAHELCLAVPDVAQSPVPIPLHLVQPFVPDGQLVRQSREHRSIVVPRSGVTFALAHDEPVLLLAVQMRGNECPRPLEPFAVESHGEPAVLLLLQQVVRAAVPDLDRSRAVLPLWDLALEAPVVERMILDVHGQRAHARLEGKPLRHGPRRERPVAFEAEVVMQPARVVALDHERRRTLVRTAGERLLRLLRVAFSPVLVEAHDAVLARRRFVRSTDSRRACIRSTTSASGCAGSGSSCPSAFARMSSISSRRYRSSYFAGSNSAVRFSTSERAISTSAFLSSALGGASSAGSRTSSAKYIVSSTRTSRYGRRQARCCLFRITTLAIPTRPVSSSARASSRKGFSAPSCGAR